MTALSIQVELGPRSYPIHVGSFDLPALGTLARRTCSGTKACVLSDSNAKVHAHFVAEALEGVGFSTHVEILHPPGEALKDFTHLAHLYDVLAGMPADRKTLIAAVGGGVIGDLVGFAAATFNRGLPLLMVPTTLLSMVDSAVGGKTGINHVKGKNLIGAFHQPVGVWIDTATLDTLPERDYRSGLAEVVKYGVILDADFFHYLEKHTAALLRREPAAVRHVVARSCRLKADIVERDEREETGVRAVLNYGHTFAHAFETVGGYGQWLHGEAVAAGMVCASRLAEMRGLVAGDVTQRQVKLLQALHLPTSPKNWSSKELLAVMRSDKKAQAGRLNFVLPRRLGEVALYDDVPEADVLAVLAEQSEE